MMTENQAEQGSSPLARGTLISPELNKAAFGLIPARAGNTTAPLSWFRRVRAHPRSRGEHTPEDVISLAVPGSSPLARGTRGSFSLETIGIGLIPARAGNTVNYSFHFTTLWAHPRSRGEHYLNGKEYDLSEGSSPLARGTLELFLVV